MTNQPFSENNAKFSSSFVFGPGDVAYISHPNINNCISWFMMIHYRTPHILCWFNSRNNNRKIMNWVSWSVGCLVLCGENRAGTGRRWTFNTEQTQSASAAAIKTEQRALDFLTHWLTALWACGLTTHTGLHTSLSMTCLLMFPSPHRSVSTNERINCRNFPPQTQTRWCEPTGAYWRLRCKSLRCYKIHLPATASNANPAAVSARRINTLIIELL